MGWRDGALIETFTFDADEYAQNAELFPEGIWPCPDSVDTFTVP